MYFHLFWYPSINLHKMVRIHQWGYCRHVSNSWRLLVMQKQKILCVDNQENNKINYGIFNKTHVQFKDSYNQRIIWPKEVNVIILTSAPCRGVMLKQLLCYWWMQLQQLLRKFLGIYNHYIERIWFLLLNDWIKEKKILGSEAVNWHRLLELFVQYIQWFLPKRKE